LVSEREWRGERMATAEASREGLGFLSAGVSPVYGGLRRKRLAVAGGF
jgi:hypothetical protein